MPIAIKWPTENTPALAAKTAHHRQGVEKQTAALKKQVAALRKNKKRKPAKQAKPRKRA